MKNKTPITVEYLEKQGFEHHMMVEEEGGVTRNGSPFLYLTSPDGRISIHNSTNLPDSDMFLAWNVHVDNEDMDTLAMFDVNCLEDANTILGVYNLKI